MDNSDLAKRVYKIADNHNVILKGSIVICGNLKCFLFGHYCKSNLFYKDFFNISKDIFSVNHIANKNLNTIKKLLKSYGYKKVWSKGVFNVYGDLRSLAVAAGFGKWGDNGLVSNEKYGDNFLITAIFFK